MEELYAVLVFILYVLVRWNGGGLGGSYIYFFEK